MKISNRTASMIDYPHRDLPDDIWYKDRAGEDRLREGVSKLMVMLSEQILHENFNGVREFYEGILMGSSLASQFYTDGTDIDVKIIVDVPKLKAHNPQYEGLDKQQLTEKLIEVVKKYKDKYEYEGRPFDFFFNDVAAINTPEYRAHYDALYNVTLDSWIKKPKFVNVDTYDRQKVIREGEEMALEWAEKWDLSLGKIQRSVRDFKLIQDHLRVLPADEKDRFKGEVEGIQGDLEREIDELSDGRAEVKKLRRDAYEKYADNIDEYFGYINALPDVIQMKMLAHWGYLKLIRELEDKVEKISERD